MDHEPLRILVPLDGSAEAESILSALSPLIRMFRTKVTLFRGVERDTSVQPAIRYLRGVKSSLEKRDVEVDLQADWGDPAERIDWLGRPGRFDLIAMSTHGRSGLRRLMMGSVAEEVLRRADLPLLACHPFSEERTWDRFVVAVDGTPWSERILSDALRLARPAGATLHLVHASVPVWVPRFPEGDFDFAEGKLRYLCGLCRRLRRENVSAVPVLRAVPSPEAVVGYAAECGAGLICLATHGRRGLARTWMGSVAEEVMRRATCPVLVRRVAKEAAPVRPEETRTGAGTPPPVRT